MKYPDITPRRTNSYNLARNAAAAALLLSPLLAGCTADKPPEDTHPKEKIQKKVAPQNELVLTPIQQKGLDRHAKHAVLKTLNEYEKAVEKCATTYEDVCETDGHQSVSYGDGADTEVAMTSRHTDDTTRLKYVYDVVFDEGQLILEQDGKSPLPKSIPEIKRFVSDPDTHFKSVGAGLSASDQTTHVEDNVLRARSFSNETERYVKVKADEAFDFTTGNIDLFADSRMY